MFYFKCYLSPFCIYRIVKIMQWNFIIYTSYHQEPKLYHENLAYRQGSPIGGWGWYPYPPWGRSAKFTKLAKSRLFSKFFFVNLIQNSTKMDFFRCRVIRWPARPPPSLPLPLEAGPLAIPAYRSAHDGGTLKTCFLKTKFWTQLFVWELIWSEIANFKRLTNFSFIPYYPAKSGMPV